MDIARIREDFDVLKGDKPVVYFDSACMSLKPVQVIDKMNEAYKEYTACAGRSSHRFGSRMSDEYENARAVIARSLGAKPGEVVFTRNTTEGLNLVSNCLELKKGEIVVTSDREHNSNLVPWQLLSDRKGIVHKVLPSSPDWLFDLDAFRVLINRGGVKLVSVVFSSNLDGYSLPVREIIKISHESGALVMLDAAQAMPHKKVNVRELDADFVAFSGHKMLGPYGTGVLYGKAHLLEALSPFIVGGETVENTTYSGHSFLKPPHRFEAGLQNYSGSIGLAAACEYLDRVGKENIIRHEIRLNRVISEGISSIRGLRILGPEDAVQRGGIISFTLEGMNHHEIAMILDRNANIMVRSGQHCVHSWFNSRGIEGSVRASLYLYNTESEADLFVREIKKLAGLR
ncbi:cysteine desulfurase [Candidatus Woesearchaeota archaeon]|nr:cysteine desulfurase [Candidatus Woesearchaeota archaeon]